MLHNIFYHASNVFPNRIAVKESNKTTTYAEVEVLVDTMATQLVKFLDMQTNFISKPILVFQRRSLAQIVTLITLSKLGITPVLVDTSAPADRIRHIFEENQPIATITDSLSQDQFSQTQLTGALTLIAENLLVQPNCLELNKVILNSIYQKVEIQKEQLTAYIVYSSGTTGYPKGIPIKHIGLDYWNTIIQKSIRIAPGENVLGFCSTGFDAHLWEYIMAWGAGACLIIFNKMEHISLAEFIKTQKINHATLIPSVLRDINLKENIKDFKSSGLKSVCSTGEACSEELVNLFDDYKIDLWNCYGPSELTFGLSILRVSRDLLINGNVPIGMPNSKEIKILIDKNGELCVSSPYQTTGYINNKKETKENFFKLNDNIYYRTKDLVSRCELNPKILFYHGRLAADSQVKINGILVNPAETERFMRQHANTQDVFVFSTKIKNSQILASCYTTKMSVDQPIYWYDYLKNYLVPEAIPILNMKMKKFPISTNGKLDKPALINLFKMNIPWLIESHIKNLDEIEKKVYAIFAEIFIIPPKNKNQNILSLGGSSISLAKLIKSIEDAFDLKNIIPTTEYLPMESLSIERCSKIISHYYLRKLTEVTLKYLAGDKLSDNLLILFCPITGEANYNEMALQIQKANLGFGVFSINLNIISNEYTQSAIKQNNCKDYLSPEIFSETIKLGKNKNFYLAGWSSGGNLAWNLSCEFERNGIEVNYLGLYDSICPSLYINGDPNLFSQTYYKLLVRMDEKYNWFDKPVKQITFHEIDKIDSNDLLCSMINTIFQENYEILIKDQVIQEKYWIMHSISLLTAARNPRQLKKSYPYIYYYENTLTYLKNNFSNLSCDTHLLSLGWINYARNCNITAHSIGLDHFDFETTQSKPAERLCYDLSKIIKHARSTNVSTIILEIEKMKSDINKLKQAFFKDKLEQNEDSIIPNTVSFQSKL